MTKRAVILAGGKGTRLRPYTVVLPKPLMPLGEYPIMEIVVRQLAKDGFEHITFAVNHQANLIEAFFGDGSKWGIKIDYSLEHKPLATMGPLNLIKDLPDNFLVMNGDILTDLDFSAFYEKHVSGDHIFSISAYHRNHVVDYGVLDVNDKSTLVGFREKPMMSYLVSMGIYMVSRDVLEYIPNDKAYGFDTLMYDLLAAEKNVQVESFEGYWMDIGRPDDYMQAIDDFAEKRLEFLDD